MFVNVQSIGFNATAKLEDYLQEKIEQLVKYNDDIKSVEVFLRLEKSDTLENKVVEVNMEVPGSDFFAKKNSKTFEEAADLVADALRRQLVKHKEKLRSK